MGKKLQPFETAVGFMTGEKKQRDQTTKRGPDELSPIYTASIVDLVLAQLEGLFLANRFTPGERLNEVYLAQRMEVSRGSLREAARKLEQRGWLVSRPNRGFFVRDFASDEVAQIYEARLCLESFAINKALPGLNRLALQSLEDSFAALDAAARESPEQEIINQIMAFHRAIVLLGENAIILRSFDALAMDTRLIMALIGGVQADPQEFVQRNRQLLETIRTDDTAQAISAIETYMAKGLSEVQDFLSSGEARP